MVINFLIRVRLSLACAFIYELDRLMMPDYSFIEVTV
jgi:hypothetical protein